MTVKIKLGGGDCAIIIRKNGLPELVIPNIGDSEVVPVHVLAATNLFMQLGDQTGLAEEIAEEITLDGAKGVALQ